MRNAECSTPHVALPTPHSALRIGQSLAEYALLMTMAIAAVMGIQTYAKRSLQARERTMIDGAVTALGASTQPTQYEPYYAQSSSTVTRESGDVTTYHPGGEMTHLTLFDDTTVKPSSWQKESVNLENDDAWR